MIEECKSYLRASPLFSQLDNENLNLLTDSMNKHVYYKGDVLVEKNQILHCIYIIAEGSAVIGFDKYEKGSILGILSFLNNTPFPKTVRVSEDATIFKITQASLLNLSHDKPNFASQIADSWAEHINCLTAEMSKIQSTISLENHI